jgi:hypothetical protein
LYNQIGPTDQRFRGEFEGGGSAAAAGPAVSAAGELTATFVR